MASRAWPAVVRALLLELAGWAALALVFLWAFLRNHAGGWDTVAAHMNLLLTLWLVLVAIRLAIRRLLPGEAPARWLGATLCATVLLALVGYYVLVVVGLSAWGRVVSWLLIKTYAGQVTDLGSMMGIPSLVTVGVPLLLLAALAWLLAGWPMRRDIVAILDTHMPRRWTFVLAAVLIGLAGVRLYEFREFPPLQQNEPVSLSLFPGHAKSGLIAGQSAWRGQQDAKAQADYRPSETADKRNVIVIVGDALRSDHMGIYGYARPTTPFLSDAVRAGRASFSRPLSAVCSESVCGLMGIARSRYVHELTGEAMSLTQVLKRHGYAIHMILGGDHANYYELKHAYGPVDSYFDGSMAKGFYMNDDELVLARSRTLPKWDGKPQMFQFHLMSSHGLGKRRADSWTWGPARYYYTMSDPSGNAAIPEAVNFYDNGIRQFDRVVETLLDELRAKGYLHNAVVAITGDHGEMLGEHNMIGHTRSVNEGALRVPLVLLRYGYGSTADISATGAGSQVDIAPTILHELEMPLPSRWSGQPLQRKPFERAIAYFQQGLRVGLIDYRQPPRVLKYWRDLNQQSEQAYDVAADPLEKADLLATLPTALKSEWRQMLLPAASFAAPNVICCSGDR